VDGHDHLFGRDAELLGGRIENPGIGLMRHDPINILDTSSCDF
jgi:hypothetical protein